MQKYSGTILKNERKIDMIVFTCCDTFDDMMTCIYDAWAARLGHSNIRLQTEPIYFQCREPLVIDCNLQWKLLWETDLSVLAPIHI